MATISTTSVTANATAFGPCSERTNIRKAPSRRFHVRRIILSFSRGIRRWEKNLLMVPLIRVS